MYEMVRLFPYFPQGLEGGGDPAVGRVYDRLLELCVPVCFRGESQRQALGAEKLRSFRALAQKEPRRGKNPDGATGENENYLSNAGLTK